MDVRGGEVQEVRPSILSCAGLWGLFVPTRFIGSRSSTGIRRRMLLMGSSSDALPSYRSMIWRNAIHILSNAWPVVSDGGSR